MEGLLFLINETKLESFPSNQFAMFGYELVRKGRNKFGVELTLILMINCQA